ncbi:neural cell adhesion molecule 1 isoform X1 [Anguilla anguilla]|uniref:neural cell adhesion molecule 1 isoform X1 n=1 Tax=Anguilla anguilla TaxID=7936 RepID=UPI0015B323CB|nr:neural cell adhesion molecule 1 isoform X1 [Anguilla anguilla]
MAGVRLAFNFGVLLLLQLPLSVTSLTAAKVEIISSAQDIEVGVRHLLLCTAGANERMTWHKDGEDVDEDQVVVENVDETSSKLIIEKARIDDSGLYSCNVEFDSGAGKATYQIFVYQRPKFVSTPTYHEFLEGQDAVLPCAAEGLPAVDVKWRRAPEERISVLPDNSLKIAKIERKHHGTYFCEASIRNRPVSEQLPISVVVNAPPTAEMHEKKKNVLAGPRTNVSISCLVNGFPTPNISWTSPPLSDATRHRFNSDRSELTIPSVVRSDFGEYTCVAANKIGETRASFTLDVTVHPAVSLSKASLEVEPGRTASVTCEASGHPPPRVHWVRKGTNVELTPSSARARAKGPTLEFEAVQPADGGLYTCVGLSDVGNDTVDFSLETWPGAPSQIGVIPGPASARLSLDAPPVNGGTPITQYVLEWRKENEGNRSQRVVQSAEPLVLPALEPYTSYLVRLAATNRLGQGAFSSEHAVRTLAKQGEPDRPLLMDSEVQVEKNSVSVPIMQQDNGSEPVIHYVVRYWPDMEDEAWKEVELPANATAINLAGLQYNTSYHLEVRAINPMGSSRSAHFSFWVPQASAVPKTAMGKGAVIAIVILIFLLLLVAVDATCCYVNRCGLLMYLAVKLLGEKAPGLKSVEEGDGDNIVDVKLNGLRAQRGSIPKQQQQQQNGAQNGVQMEVTCDKAPLTKFEKASPASDPATEDRK